MHRNPAKTKSNACGDPLWLIMNVSLEVLAPCRSSGSLRFGSPGLCACRMIGDSRDAGARVRFPLATFFEKRGKMLKIYLPFISKTCYHQAYFLLSRRQS